MSSQQPAAALPPILVAQLHHNAWAIEKMIERCRKLTHEQYTAEFEIGLGSLQRTLTHLVEAIFYFADVFNRRPYRPRMVLMNAATPTDLRSPLELADGALRESLAAFLAKHDLDEPIEFPKGGGDFVAAFAAIAQIFDHGAHHRAQMLNMLRHLGELGDFSVDPLRWAGVMPVSAP
ncbi:MAG: DinB family protein [Planctomycetota bacterium]|nr:DinB family protein [Planctomycetota bacterium]